MLQEKLQKFDRQMRLKKLIFFVIAVFAIPCLSGDYGAAFLEIGVGAEALSMGGAYCSIVKDGTAFYWNPSGLGLIKHRILSGMYGQQFGSIQNPYGQLHYAGFVQPLSGHAAIAFNWIRFSVDDIPEYPDLEGESLQDRLYHPSLRPSGNPVGYFSDTEDAFFFSFAKMLTSQFNMGWNYQDVRIDVPVGVNFKYIRQSLYKNEASGMGLDLGAMVRIHFSDLLVSDEFGIFSFGINLQDFTTTHLKWDTRHEDNIPVNVKWGISYQQPLPFSKHHLIFAFDRDTRWHQDRHFGFGYTAFGCLGLRIGLHGKNLTGGAGIRIWRVGVDYAFLTHEITHLHRISCDLRL